MKLARPGMSTPFAAGGGLARTGAWGPISAQFHDVDQPRATQTEVDWYAARLPRDAGPLLEAMAGSGRLLLPLVEAGFSLHGVDVSEAMLAACTAKLQAAGREAQLFRQNVALLNLPFRYAAAFIAGGSFQLLSDPVAAMDALARVRAHLVAPGLVFIDLYVPSEVEHPPGAPVVEVRSATLPDGSHIAQRSETRIDAAARRRDTISRYERRQGSSVVAREDATVSMTWYSEDQVSALLADTGYRDIAIEPSAQARNGARCFAVRARM